MDGSVPDIRYLHDLNHIIRVRICKHGSCGRAAGWDLYATAHRTTSHDGKHRIKMILRIARDLSHVWNVFCSFAY